MTATATQPTHPRLTADVLAKRVLDVHRERTTGEPAEEARPTERPRDVDALVKRVLEVHSRVKSDRPC